MGRGRPATGILSVAAATRGLLKARTGWVSLMRLCGGGGGGGFAAAVVVVVATLTMGGSVLLHATLCGD